MEIGWFLFEGSETPPTLPEAPAAKAEGAGAPVITCPHCHRSYILSKDRPQNTPLEEWPPAWLKIEVASLLDTPGYIMMNDRERAAAGYPATDDERRALIRGRREADAYLANPAD